MSISHYTNLLLKVTFRIFVLLLLYLLITSIAAHVSLFAHGLRKASRVLKTVIKFKINP